MPTLRLFGFPFLRKASSLRGVYFPARPLAHIREGERADRSRTATNGASKPIAVDGAGANGSAKVVGVYLTIYFVPGTYVKWGKIAPADY